MVQRVVRHVATAALLVGLAVPYVSPSTAQAAWPDGTWRVRVGTSRIAGEDRYGTAVAVARKTFPAWENVAHVVIANGEDSALSDSLSASSLCWAYDAPLLLLSRRTIPAGVKAAMREIAAANPSAKVHVVGGSSVVPAARVRDLEAIFGAGNVEQPWPEGSRYDIARGVAYRVRSVAQEGSRTIPPVAFVANGADPETFADALALSAVSAATGIPILLARRDGVPLQTQRALASLAPRDVIVAGGPATVGSGAYRAAGATSRWWGSNRYKTASEIARLAIGRGYLRRGTVGLAASLPDATCGAVLLGRSRTPMLITDSRNLPYNTARHIASGAYGIGSATLFGGTAVLTSGLVGQLSGKPSAPSMSGASGLVGGRARMRVRVGVNTTRVRFYAGTTLVLTKAVKPYSSVDLGYVRMPTRSGTLKAVADNPDGFSASSSRPVRRLVYPASTSIVIDKSDFRLYWVRDDVLVASYPVAIGRPDWGETPVAIWKIGAKYYTDPGGVYGPRKMRMYRKSGRSYVFTAYNIHGTNQEWVIGTKASHGCIRMYNRDVLDLFPRVPLGTIVQTRE